jgi:anti-repressor protein
MLITINQSTINEQQVQTVNARELHAFLEAGTPFKDWIARRIEDYGFTSDIDFSSFLSESTGGRPSKEYLLTIDMAKELSMVERNAKGKQARQYFIECEKQAKQPQQPALPQTYKEALLALVEKVDAIEKLEAQAQIDKPKALFADSVACADTTILIGELAKILKGNGVDVGQNRMFDLLRKDGYLISRKGSDTNMPTQKSMELGLFKIKETVISHSDGHTTINKTPKVTGKGQIYFVNKYKKPLDVNLKIG